MNFIPVSVYFLRGRRTYKFEETTIEKEPTTRQILNSLYPLVDRDDLERDVDRSIRKYVTYDASDVDSVEHFRQIANNTECIFAKRAKIWGNKDWDHALTLGTQRNQ